MRRLHAQVEGRVQGVGYSDYVQKRARELGLTGWVRNLDDGTVEVLAEGEDVALSRLALSLEKGPPLSRVDEVHSTYELPSGMFSAFIIRH